MFRQTLKSLMSLWTYWSRIVTRLLKEAGALLSQCRLPRFCSPQERGLLSEFCALVKCKSQSLNLLSNFLTMKSRVWDLLTTTLRPRLKSGEAMGRSFYFMVLEHLRSIRLKVSKGLTESGLRRRRLFRLIRLRSSSPPSVKRDQNCGSVGTQETQPTQSISCSTVRSPHLIRFTRKSDGKITRGSQRF